MKDYEEYFMYDEKFMLKEDFDPRIMGKMLLEKQTGEKFFSNVLKYEFLDYVFVLSEYTDLFHRLHFDDEDPGEVVNEKVCRDLKMCYDTFLSRFEKDDDVLFVFGYLMDTCTWAYSIGVPTEYELGMEFDDIMNVGRDYRKQAEIMGNSVAIAFNAIDDGERKVSDKVHKAIHYIEQSFPESYCKKKLVEYIKDLCRGCEISF